MAVLYFERALPAFTPFSPSPVPFSEHTASCVQVKPIEALPQSPALHGALREQCGAQDSQH